MLKDKYCKVLLDLKYELSHEKIIILVVSGIQERSPLLLTYLNQNCYNIAVKDEKYLAALKRHFVIYPDGVGMHIVIRIFNKIKINFFNASDINRDILDYLIARSIPVFIIGGRFLERNFIDKDIKLAGYSNGFEESANVPSLIKQIESANPSVIIIGISVPKQEFLAYEISKHFKGPIVCVGNFLEFFTGNIKRAPAFLHNSGFEWLHRLFKEPGRLWRRYLLGIPLFIFYIIRNCGLGVSRKND